MGPGGFPLAHTWEMGEKQVCSLGVGITGALLRRMNRGGIFTSAYESELRLQLEAVVHSSKYLLDIRNVPFGQRVSLISFLYFNACLVQYNALHWQLIPKTCFP